MQILGAVAQRQAVVQKARRVLRIEYRRLELRGAIEVEAQHIREIDIRTQRIVPETPPGTTTIRFVRLIPTTNLERVLHRAGIESRSQPGQQPAAIGMVLRLAEHDRIRAVRRTVTRRVPVTTTTIHVEVRLHFYAHRIGELEFAFQIRQLVHARALRRAEIRSIADGVVRLHTRFRELLGRLPAGEVVEHRTETDPRILLRTIEHTEREIHVVALFAIGVVVERRELGRAREEVHFRVHLLMPGLPRTAEKSILPEQRRRLARK